MFKVGDYIELWPEDPKIRKYTYDDRIRAGLTINTKYRIKNIEGTSLILDVPLSVEKTYGNHFFKIGWKKAHKWHVEYKGLT